MDLPPELIASLSWNQQSTYLPVAGAGLFIYDYVLTLSDEARYVWTAPWSLGKILFLLTRYPTFIDVALAMYRNLGYSLTSGTCSLLYNISGWTTIIGIAIAEIIMLMRVWAIWNQTRTAGLLLATLIIASMIGAFVSFVKFHEKQEFIELYKISPNLQGCYGTVGTKVVFIIYVIATVFEILMVILMIVKGMRDSVRRDSSSLLYNVYQDGILYYVVLFASSVANTVLILAGPPEFTNALSMYDTAAALKFYDYLLTIIDESNLVWAAPWSFGKVVFFLTRYPAFVDISLMLYFVQLNSIAPNLHGCFTIRQTPVYYQGYLLLMAYETLIAGLMLAKGAFYLRHGSSSYITGFYKDGVVYYAALLNLKGRSTPCSQPESYSISEKTTLDANIILRLHLFVSKPSYSTIMINHAQ
ncbi:hypothetical protein EYR38_005222 [Pleurotus pulmonarius]|nr:hypothetical protein EYR38_005222 [Pleurotus pulmonarius]